MAIVPNKNPMPNQDPKVRAHNFEEVALGYSAEVAIAEANRCLNCKNRPCVSGCPVNIDIPEFISEIKEGKFEEARIGIFAYDKNVIPYLNSNINFESGIYVAQISLDSPAYGSGLEIGDVIMKIPAVNVVKSTIKKLDLITPKKAKSLFRGTPGTLCLPPFLDFIEGAEGVKFAPLAQVKQSEV